MIKDMFWDISNSGVNEDDQYVVYLATKLTREEFTNMTAKLKEGNMLEVQL